MSFKMNFVGLDEAIKRVEALASTLDAEEVEDVLLEGAEIIAAEARRIVSVRSGKLQKNIKVKRGKRKDRSVANALAAVNFKVARHAYLVEYGTSSAPAHPYFRPAVDNTMSDVQRTVEDGLRKLVEGGVS